MTRDASIGKRDFGLDTRAMEEFARSLLEREWMESVEEDLDAMNRGKMGRLYRFTERMIRWAVRLRHALGISYRMARGFLNHFLADMGLPGISLTQFYSRCRDASAVASEALDIPYSSMSFVCGEKIYYLCETTPSRLLIGCMPPGITFGGKTVDEWLHAPDMRGYGYCLV